MSNRIEITVEDHVAVLTLSHPPRHNALDQEAWRAIPGVIAHALERDARVLIVRGAGGNFCAGADIGEFDAVRGDQSAVERYERANREAFSALRHFPLPTIAAIDGFCLGGGFGIAAACDIRLAAPEAIFGVPAARLGLAYPVEAMADIVEAVGRQMASRMLFTAARFDAAEMERAGFVSLIEGETSHAAAETLARQIAQLAPLTHRATKAAIDAALGADAAHAEALGAATSESADYAEGRLAFREKRKPRFTGS